VTRKDVNALAVALNGIKPEHRADTHQWEDAVNAIADACARSNARFNREWFLAACGVAPNPDA